MAWPYFQKSSDTGAFFAQSVIVFIAAKSRNHFVAGVRYGLRRAAKANRRNIEDLMDETEISAAETLRQALDVDEPEPPLN